MPMPHARDLGAAQYQALADLRYQIVASSEAAARRPVEVEPQQHQLLLVLKASRSAREPTIGVVASAC